MSCGGVFVVVFLSLCLCGGVFVVVFLWWCFCGGVCVLVFLWWCFCGGVSVVVFLWWCFCGVVAVVFLWWCFCGGVFVVVVVVFLWWCTKYYSSTTKYYILRTTKYYSVLQSTTPVLLGTTKYYSSTTPYYKVLLRTTKYYSSTTKYYSVLQSTTRVLQSTTPYYKVLLTTPILLRTTKYYSSTTPILLCTTKYYSSTTKYYSILQSTTPVLLRTTKYYSRTTKYYSNTTPYYKVLLQYYSNTTLYYKVLLQYYSVLQSTTPVLLQYYSNTTLYYKVLLQYYKVLLQHDSNTTLHYKVLLQYYSVLQSTTPTSETTSERRPSSTTPYYASITKASKTSISCEASATFQGTSFQNQHFVRGFFQISQNELPKRAFRARLPQLFKEQASKTSISCEASSKFHRTSFQNERFARCFRQFSQKKLPKGSFRARLLPNFTEEASKTSVSRDASSKIHRTSFQNERFARCFRQFSQKKLPKWSFRARHPPNFIEQCFQNERFARCFRQFSPKICVSLQFRAIDTPIPARGSSAKSKMCLALQRRAFPNFKMYVSLQRRAQKCMNLSTVNRPASRTQKCNVLLQFWAIDTTFLLRGFTASKWNLRFATFLGDRHHLFTERVGGRQMKLAFRYIFGRSTPRFYWEGSPRANEISVSLHFWAIDTTFLLRGFTASKWNLRFATFLGDRHHVFTERVGGRQMKFAFRYSFGRSTPRF